MLSLLRQKVTGSGILPFDGGHWQTFRYDRRQLRLSCADILEASMLPATFQPRRIRLAPRRDRHTVKDKIHKRQSISNLTHFVAR